MTRKLISVKKEDSMPLNKKRESSIEEQYIPDIVKSTICKDEERRVNAESGKDIEKEILSGKCLSDMAINLVISKQFLSINGLEHTELGLGKLFSIRKGKFFQIPSDFSASNI